jgi:hypothetical protein
MLTKEDIASALPANLKGAATQALTDQVNTLVSDPTTAEHIREHFISYAVVLSEGKWSLEAYMNAIQYVTYKMMGYSNQESYQRTFPQRYAHFIANGTSAKDISAYVSQYNKGKLVNLIQEKALIPVHVLYQDTFHEAIRHAAFLMTNAQSEKVQMEAANALMTHLGKPKDAAPALAIQINNSLELDALRSTLVDVSDRQRELIKSGVTAKEIAGTKLFNIKPVDDMVIEHEPN